MLERVLVANRGEIAVRVMRACEELGIDTVAVYSDADAEGEHVRYADEAYNMGPARAAESYLDHDAILDIAEEADADAIHPGYGFLAENARFARKVEQTDGVTWVGPSADAMEELGEKTRARRAMSNAGVPIVPGTTEPVAEPEEVVEFGDEYGYPVVIKAEGGGGGRGMKVVEGPEAVADQLESAKREGEAYFDNDSVYLERYLENSRHVEVQILADEHGNVRHLGERDCSLQRRHQKVIEEGPSPALSDELREQIGDAARRGVDVVGYTNAGTVEFIVEEDPEREAGEVLGPETNFYFLEVNTRIQVEHTVTEELTGIDIVKWQLRIADGQKLGFSQDEVELDGHAMEFRINAENAAKEFQPAAGGKLVTYDPPGGIGVRMDDALRQGDRLVTDYDSMIAKLIVWDSGREECIKRSLRAFREYDLEGVVTTIPFHRLMLTDEAFVAGTHTTKYLDEEIDLDAVADAQARWGSDATGGSAGDEGTASGQSLTVEIDGKRFDVHVTDPGKAAVAGGSTAGAGGVDAGTDESTAADVAVSGDGQRVTADMQGTVLDVEVDVGDEVAAGDVLLVLEAMKMENDVVADLAGTVSAVRVNAGDSVSMGDTLLVLE